MKRIIAVLILICIAVMPVGAVAMSADDIQTVINDVADCIIKTVPDPSVGSTGGEWAVIGLVRSGRSLPDGYLEGYYDNVVKYASERDGVLHDRKYTEYSRVVLALSAIGKNPSDVGGYDLLTPLGDYDRTVWQGINGACYALIALDSAGYDMPENGQADVQATGEMYIDNILSCRGSDGGFSLTGTGSSEIDATAMALQALAPYKSDADVMTAIADALGYLSAEQNSDGSFSDQSGANSESCAQVVTALSILGLPIDDERFVKNGNTALDGLMSFYKKGEGFIHYHGTDEINLMSTEQALYALVSVSRQMNGEKALYDFSDVVMNTDSEAYRAGLYSKNENVKIMPVVHEGKTFDDIQNNEYKVSIEQLASREIISGRTENLFEPDATMTRAEFAAITVKALGLEPAGKKVFDDVSEDDWFFGYVAVAYECGIINGVSETEFNPHGTITKEEAAAMTARTATLCGVSDEMNDTEIQNMLAQFDDYKTVSPWAQKQMAVCYKNEILSQEDISINPHKAVLRCEIADMLYNMLKCAMLL